MKARPSLLLSLAEAFHFSRRLPSLRLGIAGTFDNCRMTDEDSDRGGTIRGKSRITSEGEEERIECKHVEAAMSIFR